MKSLMGLVALTSLTSGSNVSYNQPATTFSHTSFPKITINQQNQSKDLNKFNLLQQEEVDEDTLETYTYKKTSNFSKSFVTLKKDNEKQTIKIVFKIKEIFKEIVDLAKKAGQIKSTSTQKSFYEQIKDDILIDAYSWMSTSRAYITLKDDPKNIRQTSLGRVCGSFLLTDITNECDVFPLGRVKKIRFVLNLDPSQLLFHRKSAVQINKTYQFVSNPNPAANSFYGMEVFNNKKLADSVDEFVNLRSELDIWRKDVLSSRINADFSDTIWANQNSIAKNLKKGVNLYANFDFSSVTQGQFPVWILWLPVFIFFSPFVYYFVRKTAKI